DRLYLSRHVSKILTMPGPHIIIRHTLKTLVSSRETSRRQLGSAVGCGGDGCKGTAHTLGLISAPGDPWPVPGKHRRDVYGGETPARGGGTPGPAACAPARDTMQLPPAQVSRQEGFATMNQPNFFSRRITRRELLSTGAKMAAGLSAVGAVGPLLRSLGGPSLASAQSNFTGQLSLLLGSHMEPVVKIAQLYEERYGVKPSVELVTTPDLEAKLSATFLARHPPWDASFATASLAASLASRGWLKNADRFINEK